MSLKILDGFWLSSDGRYCFVLEEMVKKSKRGRNFRNGNENEFKIRRTYHPTIENVLTTIVNRFLIKNKQLVITDTDLRHPSREDFLDGMEQDTVSLVKLLKTITKILHTASKGITAAEVTKMFREDRAKDGRGRKKKDDLSSTSSEEDCTAGDD